MQRMTSSSTILPENRHELVDLVQKQASQIEQLEAKLRWFEEQFHLARHKQFGTSSERSVKEQRNLFNEAEAVAEAGPVEECIRQTITYDRKKPGRKALPQDLPRIEVVHDLTERYGSSDAFSIFAPENRQFSAWIGASKTASSDFPAFCETCVSKSQYNELGSSSIS